MKNEKALVIPEEIKIKAKEQLEQLKLGTVDFISEHEILNKLELSLFHGKPLMIKFGADPTRSDLHLGHTVVLNKLRQFQDLGHQVQFIIGDFTALIGDPTGRNQTRPALTPSEIKQNATSYAEQVFKILDKEKTTLYYNSEWLNPLSSADFIKLTAQYTVARMIERDDFQKRLASGIPISMHELLYPLCQGYDSVVLKSDIELGGTDQKFNLLVGRELQKSYGQTSTQNVMTCPLLEGIDGVQKMSKSYDNYISVVDTPREMFGKTMRISDELMVRWYELLTNISPIELEKIKEQIKNQTVNPRDLKVNLAQFLVTRFYSSFEAEKAKSEFFELFSNKGLPEDIQVFEKPAGSYLLIEMLVDLGLTTSKSESKRMIAGRAVELNQEKVLDENCTFSLSEGQECILKVGKKKFAKIVAK